MPEPWDPVPGDPGELTDQDYWPEFQIEEEVVNQNRLAEEGSIFDEAVDWSDVKNPKLSDKDKNLHRKKVLKKETNRRANKLARTNRKKNRKK